ncbi:MAG: hypothetical protein LBT88_07145 [Oscillospiraceae bacterium]|nr:hypothetical protein [Oscillospiraceae bacterium]
MNIFKLRPAAKVELFILKEDGTPLTGDITVSGGVYKNGKYCEATEIRDELYTLTSDRKLTITMDPDKFWTTNNDEGLTPSDQLDYVFIARSPNDGYYPLYIKVDGSVGADDSVVFATNAVVAGKVPTDRKNKPFISAIAARHADGGTVWSPILRHNGVVGITDTAPGLEELDSTPPFCGGARMQTRTIPYILKTHPASGLTVSESRRRRAIRSAIWQCPKM